MEFALVAASEGDLFDAPPAAFQQTERPAEAAGDQIPVGRHAEKSGEDPPEVDLRDAQSRRLGGEVPPGIGTGPDAVGQDRDGFGHLFPEMEGMGLTVDLQQDLFESQYGPGVMDRMGNHAEIDQLPALPEQFAGLGRSDHLQRQRRRQKSRADILFGPGAAEADIELTAVPEVGEGDAGEGEENRRSPDGGGRSAPGTQGNAAVVDELQTAVTVETMPPVSRIGPPGIIGADKTQIVEVIHFSPDENRNSLQFCFNISRRTQ